MLQAPERNDLSSPAAPRVRAAATSGLCAALEQIGAEPARLLGRARLKPEDLDEPLSWLFLTDYCELLEQASDHCDADTFGLRLGLQRATEVLGDLGPLATAAPTLASAFDGISRYFGALQEQTLVGLERQGDRIAVTYQIRNGHIVRRRQDAELSLGAMIGCMRLCLGAHWSPQEVHFEHARPSRVAEHDALLGAPVYFGQCRNAILLAADDFGALMPSADPRRWAELRQRVGRRLPEADAQDFVGAVLQEIRDALAKGNPGVEGVARRLKTCGVEFSDLQRDLRRELALMHIRQPHLPLTEIALALGYSELSAFSRAFRTWTGVSPNLYRRRCHGI